MIDRIASRFDGRFLRGWVRGKLRGDPIFEATAGLVQGSDLPLVDMGCGLGLLSFYLREKGFNAPIIGVDFDTPKISIANRLSSQYRGLHFDATDIFAWLKSTTFQGHIVMADLLHYLPEEKQHALLQAAVPRIAPGGLCIIRETPRARTWRFRATQLEEFVIHRIGWMKSGAKHYLAKEEITAPFAQAGFEISIAPLWGRTPFNSHLFTFSRPATSG